MTSVFGGWRGAGAGRVVPTPPDRRSNVANAPKSGQADSPGRPAPRAPLAAPAPRMVAVPPVKLVSDFDGVWTLPDDEARAQGEVLESALTGWLPETERAAAAGWIRAARAAVLRAPQRYGWAVDGRVSAFADEDPFVRHSAFLHYVSVHAAADPMAAKLEAAARAHGHDGLDALGGWSHAEGVKRVAATRGPGILPESAAAGHAMLDTGVEVAVVSNSGTDKLAAWFAHAGVPARVHPERAPGALRLRGSARKFILDAGRSDLLELGGLRFETARPSYEAVLRDEMPGAVVGDVFSLDLALPLALKRREKAFAGMRLLWLVRDYTPAWLREAIEPALGGDVELVEGGLGAVAHALGR